MTKTNIWTLTFVEYKDKKPTMTGRWQVKWGRQKEDTSELSMKMSLDMALKNFIVPLQSFQVKKKKKSFALL